MSLSTALCRPTSSAVSTMSPSRVQRAAACSPPVSAKVSCRGASAPAVHAWHRRRPHGARDGWRRQASRREIGPTAHAARRVHRHVPSGIALGGDRRRPRRGQRDVDDVAGRIDVDGTMSADLETIPSVKRKPTASSRSAPGVRIITENGAPFSLTSSAASTATSSVDVSIVAPSTTRTTNPLDPFGAGHGGRITSTDSMALFGLDQQKPRHFREMFRIAWENRDQLPFAWRILNHGVLRRLRARHVRRCRTGRCRARTSAWSGSN